MMFQFVCLDLFQAMLPWVTTALTEDEQNTMMDTLRQATRNTMFDKWLSAWWKDTPTSNPHSPPLVTNDQITPPSGTTESLQMVVDYLSRGVVTMKETMNDGKNGKSNSLQCEGKNCNTERPLGTSLKAG